PTTVALILTMVIISFVMTSMSQLERTRDLRDRVMHDGLTGVLARGEFLDRAAALVARSAGRSRLASVVLADLDNFKGLNDTHGHAAGDAALQHFGQA